MKQIFTSFLKWWILAFVLMFFLGSIKILLTNFGQINLLRAFVILLIGAALLALFFVFTQYVLVPWRKKQLLKKVCKMFQADYLNSDTVSFQYKEVLVYVRVDIQLRMSQVGGATELITFVMVPLGANKSQEIYQCSPYKLKRARQVLKEKLEKI